MIGNQVGFYILQFSFIWGTINHLMIGNDSQIFNWQKKVVTHKLDKENEKKLISADFLLN